MGVQIYIEWDDASNEWIDSEQFTEMTIQELQEIQNNLIEAIDDKKAIEMKNGEIDEWYAYREGTDPMSASFALTRVTGEIQSRLLEAGVFTDG